MNPVNNQELKEWIIRHANFYRNQRKGALTRGNFHHFEGHMRAMRALWDTLKVFEGITLSGLYKEVESEKTA